MWVRAILALMLMTSAAHAGCNDTLLIFKDWKVVPLNSDQVQMTTDFKSTADKPITMIKATAGYIDALGDTVVTFNLDKDVEIAPGSDYVEVKNWDRDAFQRMLILKHSEVKTFLCIEAVLYNDGTKDEF
jgi:hypothetical protein